MKRIKLPSRCIIVPDEKMDLQEAYDLLEAARLNGLEVINATLAYEKYMEEIIQKYLFIEQDDQRIGFFQGHMLSADWFSYSAKRKVLLGIVEEIGIFKSEDKNQFERRLRQIMSYRNAFAHGDIIVRNNNAIISYFEGRRREDVMDDKYWESLESVYLDTWNFITDIREAMGIKDDVLDIPIEKADDN